MTFFIVHFSNFFNKSIFTLGNGHTFNSEIFVAFWTHKLNGYLIRRFLILGCAQILKRASPMQTNAWKGSEIRLTLCRCPTPGGKPISCRDHDLNKEMTLDETCFSILVQIKRFVMLTRYLYNNNIMYVHL